MYVCFAVLFQCQTVVDGLAAGLDAEVDVGISQRVHLPVDSTDGYGKLIGVHAGKLRTEDAERAVTDPNELRNLLKHRAA